MKTGTIFINLENNKTSDSQRPMLNIEDKMNLKRGDTYVALSNLSIFCT